MNNTNKWKGRTKFEILIVGKGGEGVSVATDMLGEAATLDGLFASTRSTYSASQRGESVFSEIIISNKPIQFNFVERPDFFLAFSQQGLNDYCFKLKYSEKPLIFIESTSEIKLPDLLENLEKLGKSDIIQIAARKTSLESNIPLSYLNIIMVGAFIKHTKLVSENSLKKTILNKFSDSSAKTNLKALKMGLTYFNN